MPRIRLVISGIATRDEAEAAMAAGADAIGLDPALFPQTGLAGNDILADIALALPPAVTPILITPALTAGTVVQQVDAAAALAVRLTRPVDSSEYPGLKRIIRGRKIIQSIDPAAADAASLVRAYAPLADALHVTAGTPGDLSACRNLAALSGLPWFLGLADPALLRAAMELHPYAVDIAVPARGGFGAWDLHGIVAALAAG